MPEAGDLIGLDRGAIVAPAGHGKTELIAKVAALSRRALVLTHTNAGIQAVRARLKRLRVPQSTVAVNTISGWCLRYAHAFPGIAQPPVDMPIGAQWDEVHSGVRAALSVPAIRQVLESSYDRILIDEYQDCNSHQHALAVELSGIVPTLIFGDPMQGIFEFAGATLSWDGDIRHSFPFVGELETPHRWREKNPELGEWIAYAREQLIRGERIDLTVGPLAYRHATNAFDMDALFESIEGKEGPVAAIHCNKGICYRLAAAARGGYQAIEEMAARTMTDFSRRWDAAADRDERLQALRWLFSEAFTVRKLAEAEAPPEGEAALTAAMQAAAASLGQDSPQRALEILSLARKLPRWRVHRQELVRDIERALSEVAAGRCDSMLAASTIIRDRTSFVGRKLPRRTVSTPLLLKGLEFDHVVVPDSAHFGDEQNAQAKLFYVAISRPSRSLTITGPQGFVQFSAPRI